MGKDMFYFKLVPDNGMLPNGLPYTNSKYLTGNPQNFTGQCNLSKNGGTNGRECTAWVIYNGNMDYLHCNDLSWDGKHKCK